MLLQIYYSEYSHGYSVPKYEKNIKVHFWKIRWFVFKIWWKKCFDVQLYGKWACWGQTWVTSSHFEALKGLLLQKRTLEFLSEFLATKHYLTLSRSLNIMVEVRSSFGAINLQSIKSLFFSHIIMTRVLNPIDKRSWWAMGKQFCIASLETL